MSWTTDRTIQDNRLLLIIVLVVVVFVAAGGFLYFRTRQDAQDTSQKQLEQNRTLIQPAFRNEPLAVTIYYPVGDQLLSGTASVKRQPDAQAQAREALAAVFADQRAAQTAVFRDIKLKAFYLDGRGTAYIDLTPSSQRDIRAATSEELLAVYAMVNTVMQNFEEIKQVAFLVDGRDAQTLAGHLDLSRMFTKRMDLVKQ
jgi:flagellar basal body-associated protein FliL